MPVYLLNDSIAFPDPMLADEIGLLAVGGDLSCERLLKAYSMGIFPWFSEGDPLLWWSLDPRMILFPHEFRVSRSLRKSMRRHQYVCKTDTCFATVMEACAGPRKREAGTWITTSMIEAYVRLHEMGYAHSFEVYSQGELAGGMYGVSLGKAFFGESMFFRTTDASKAALYFLCRAMVDWEFHFLDAQQPTRHLAGLGAQRMGKARFLELLGRALQFPTRRGRWDFQEEFSPA
jgi:leucyl/phenylalanyl-tRNA---protein transferase